MNHKLLFLLICLISLNSQAQRIASTILLQDGIVVDSSHVFLDGDRLTFTLQNEPSRNVYWSFSCYNDKGKKQLCRKSDKGIKNFTVKVEPNLFKDNLYSIQKIEYPNDSSVYIRCSVDLFQGNIVKDSVSFLLNILPSRAKVKKASIKGNFDFDEGGYNPFAEITVLFSADRMNDFRLFSYTPDSAHVFQFPGICEGIYYTVNFNKKGQNIYEFRYDYVDWGEFYSIITYNKYGVVCGDTLFTTSLIEDPQIINYINSIHNRTSSVNEVKDDNIRLHLHHNIIVIENLTNSSLQTSIYSLDGTLIRSYSTSTIDLNDLCKGIYVVKIRSNPKTITQKINKI